MGKCRVKPAELTAEPTFRLLAINQVTSSLFRDLVTTLAKSCSQVRLLSGFLEESPQPCLFGWIRACELVRSPGWKRLWTWGRFTWQALQAMRCHRDHFVLMTTNPPFVPWIAPLAKRLFNIRYGLVVYDVYPDVLSRIGMIRRNGLAERVLRRLSARSMLEAECVITLGEHMKQTILAHMPADKTVPVEVIPNWADIETIRRIPRALNPFAQEHGLVDKFVVMYSGNFGATHDVDSIVDAAESLVDLPNIEFVLIGGGTRLQEVRRYVQSKALPNLLLLDWVPAGQLRYSVTSADCLVVSLDEGFEGISVPGKTYTSLAAGAAILAVTSPNTELAEVVMLEHCGVCIPPRSSSALSSAVRMLYEERALLKEMQFNSRAAAEARYNVTVCTRRYLEVLLPLITRSSRP